MANGVTYWRPEDGFISGGYTVFKDSENKEARAKAEYMAKKYFIEESTAQYEINELAKLLANIAQEQSAIEREYLRLKIDALPKEAEDLKMTLRGFLVTGNYSAIYDKLLMSDERLKQFTKSRQKGGEVKDPLQNSVHGRAFGNFLRQAIYDTFQVKRGSRSLEDIAGDGSIPLDDMIDKFVRQNVIDDKSNDMYKAAVDQINKDIDNANYTNNAFLQGIITLNKSNKRVITVDSLKKALKKSGNFTLKNSKGKGKTLKGYITEQLSKANIATGLIVEFDLAANTNTKVSMRTGGLQGKADTIHLESFGESLTIDTDELADSLAQDIGAAKEGAASLQNTITYLQDRIKDLTNVFLITTSAKDYRSNRDFKLQGSTLENTLKRIEPLSEKFPTGMSIKDLRFFFGNIIAGASLEDHKDTVENFLKNLAVAYMFDDMQEIFSVGAPSELKIIHLFYINGSYFSLSDILRKIATDVAGVSVNNVADFATISIHSSAAESKLKEINAAYHSKNGDYDSARDWPAMRSAAGEMQIDVELSRDVIRNFSLEMYRLLRGN